MTRWVAPVVLVALLVACADPAVEEAPDPAASVAAPSETAPEPSPEPSLPPSPTPTSPAGPAAAPSPSPPPLPAAWTAPEGEVLPNAKTAAAAVVHALTNHEVGTTPQDVAEAVAGDPAQVRALAAAATNLVDPERWSRGAVRYGQLGGLGDDAVSVMVVVEQRRGRGGEVEQVETRTLDVRLRLEDDAWAFDGLASDGGPVVPRPDQLSEAAAAVLDDPRIHLTDSNRWDIHAGGVHPDLLALLLQIADRTEIGVVTFTRGHPVNVFGTDRRSNHTRGRAVDIHRVGEGLVVDQREEGSPAHDLVRFLYDQTDVPELGSPWALDGFGGRSFTDVVHADHLHVAVADD